MEQLSYNSFTGPLASPAWSKLDALVAPEAKAVVNELLASKLQEIESEGLASYLAAVNNAPRPTLPASVDFTREKVVIGQQFELTDHDALLASLKAFIPWKKGPFSLFGHTIDAEWRSDQKWDRILPHISSLKDKVVADIGCHNGYFMFRMAEQEPKAVIGIEPVMKHWLAFQMLNGYAQQANLLFAPLGVEHMNLMPNAFDTVFCLGILYHHTDPVGLLRKIGQSMNRGGELIIDCQGIPGEDPVALTPSGRYARARGIWFLPTQPCLENWVRRAGYSQIETFFAAPLLPDEQRSTAWAPVASLESFLDPNDASKTVEGYPAPWRFYLKAKK